MTDKKITMVDAPEMKVTEEMGHLVIRFTEPVSFEKDNTITIELDKFLQTAITTAREGVVREILGLSHYKRGDSGLDWVIQVTDIEKLLTLKGNHE